MLRSWRLIPIWFWSNFLVGYCRLTNVPRCMRMINTFTQWLPSAMGDLNLIAEMVDRLLTHSPWLFIYKRQVCLIRGLIVYFYGKRLRKDVTLQFGSKFSQGKLRTHCWTRHENTIYFESEAAIREYVVLIDYT